MLRSSYGIPRLSPLRKGRTIYNNENNHTSSSKLQACTCMRAVNFNGGPPYCDECRMEVYDMSPRYKVKVLVSGGIDSGPLILFDSECYYLLIGNTRIFYLRQRKTIDADPQQILNLVGHDLLFRVEKKEYNLFLYDGCYSVRKICSDSSLINDYKDMVDDDTPLKPNSLLQHLPNWNKLKGKVV